MLMFLGLLLCFKTDNAFPLLATGIIDALWSYDKVWAGLIGIKNLLSDESDVAG